MLIDVILIEVQLLELGVLHDRLRNQLDGLVAKSVELETNGEDVRLLRQHPDKLVDRIIVYFIVVEVDLLQTVIVRESHGYALKARIADAIVLNGQLDEAGVTLQTVISNVACTCLS